MADEPERTEPEKTELICPCGAWLEGANEDDLVEQARQHLREAHGGREYSRDEILFLAH
jgi:predicted small metal-binding protein